MKPLALVAVIALGLPAAGSPLGMADRSAALLAFPAQGASTVNAASVIGKCADAMGGAAAIKTLRTIRVEIVYPDHGGAPIVVEVRRPNRLRTESAGRYIMWFDGQRAGYQDLDPARKGQGPRLVPASALADMDVDIAWLVPAFFDNPAEYLGTAQSGGTLCHKLGVTLPLGARAVYFVDASTNLVKTIAVDVTVEGRPFHAEREWMNYRTVQGIRYPGAMTYSGRDKGTQTALIKSVELNPPLDDSRFMVPADAK